MTAGARRVLLAGTAGGVGVTTVTALLFTGLRSSATAAPRLLDHTAGDLGTRLPDGDRVPQLSDQLLLQDVGKHALRVGAAALAEPSSVLVLVTAATPVGCALAGSVLESVRRAHGPTGTARTVLVLAEVFGRHRIGRHVRELAAAPGPAGLLMLPADPALALGGRIPVARLSRSTVRAVDTLMDLVHPGRRAQSASNGPA